MATTYDYETFNDKVLPKSFKQEQRDLINVAAQLGWIVKVTSGTSVTLVSYDGKKTFHFSARRKSQPIQRMKRDLVRFGDPVRVAYADAVFSGEWRIEPPEIKVEFARPEDEPKKEPQHPVEPKEKPKPVVVPTPAQVAERVQEKRHIVSERPFLAHYQKGSKTTPGKSYPSKAIIERLWSDGTTDYKCALCVYSAPKTESIRSHWQVHVRAGQVKKFDQAAEAPKLVVEDPTYLEHAYTKKPAENYKPRAERVHALAQEIKFVLTEYEGMDLGTLAEFIAERALTWVGVQQGGGGEGGEPLTDAQVIERIRRLVDRGEYVAQRQALQAADSQIVTLTDRLADMEQQLSEAKASHERLRANMQAFRELAAELSEEAEHAGESDTPDKGGEHTNDGAQ